MLEPDMMQLVYLTLLLAVIGYWTFSRIEGNWRKIGRIAMVWIAIFAILLIMAHLFGLSI